jgi:hypothetical protein
MSEYIIKLNDKKNDFYLIWSTVTKSPLSKGMSLEKFKDFYRFTLKESGIALSDEKGFEERLKRANQTDCSAFNYNLDEIIMNNRAGDNKEKLTKGEILKKYCSNSIYSKLEK